MQRGFEQTVKGITKWSYEFLKGSDTEIPHREEKLYYHVIRLSNYIDRVTAFPLSWKKLQRPRFKIWIFDYTLFFLPSFLLNPPPLHLTVPNPSISVYYILDFSFIRPFHHCKNFAKRCSRIASRQISPSCLCYLE